MDAVTAKPTDIEQFRAILRAGGTLPPVGHAERPEMASVRDAPATPPGPRLGARKLPGRFHTLNAFVDFSLEGLTRAEIVTWLILFRDSREGMAKTSQVDIARRGGLSRRNVARAIKRLEDCGLLKVVYRGGLRKGMSSYHLQPYTETSVR